MTDNINAEELFRRLDIESITRRAKEFILESLDGEIPDPSLRVSSLEKKVRKQRKHIGALIDQIDQLVEIEKRNLSMIQQLDANLEALKHRVDLIQELDDKIDPDLEHRMEMIEEINDTVLSDPDVRSVMNLPPADSLSEWEKEANAQASTATRYMLVKVDIPDNKANLEVVFDRLVDKLAKRMDLWGQQEGFDATTYPAMPGHVIGEES